MELSELLNRIRSILYFSIREIVDFGYGCDVFGGDYPNGSSGSQIKQWEKLVYNFLSERMKDIKENDDNYAICIRTMLENHIEYM